VKSNYRKAAEKKAGKRAKSRVGNVHLLEEDEYGKRNVARYTSLHMCLLKITRKAREGQEQYDFIK
jgi:hypothetical protein